MSQQPVLLLQYKRDSLIEQEHYGFISHCNKTHVLNIIGNSFEELFFLRSCMKPLQASLLIDFDLINHFNLTYEEIAVCSASHVGEKEHITIILDILKRVRLNEADLKCPPGQPLSKLAQAELLKNNQPPTKVHYNCSGKHVLMLMSCLKNGWDTKTYDEIEHPLQQFIFNKIRSLSEYNRELILSKDGCGLPVCALPLKNINFAYLNLFLDSKYKQLKTAFLKHPYLIGGSERLDSEIINASGGQLVAKVGACGLCTVVNIEKQEALTVKISDSNMSARAIVTIEILKKLGWLSEKQIENNPLNTLFNKEIRTSHNELIGFIECKI